LGSRRNKFYTKTKLNGESLWEDAFAIGTEQLKDSGKEFLKLDLSVQTSLCNE